MVVTRSQTKLLPILIRFFRQLKGINRIDPITQEYLKFPLFFHVTSNQTFAFHAPSLIKYIEASGDFRNPFTRQEFNVIEIRRLQKHCNIDLASSIYERQKKREEDLARNSLFNFLYSDCLSQIELCLDELTKLSESPLTISSRCLQGPCIEYIRSINQLLELNHSKAVECVQDSLARLTEAIGDPRIVYHPIVFPSIVEFYTNVSRSIRQNRRLIGAVPFRM